MRVLEHVVGAEREHRVAAAASDVAEGVSEKCLSDSDGPDDGEVMMRLEEAKRDELVEQRLVERHFAGLVPRFELHHRIEASALRAERAGQAVAS